MSNHFHLVVRVDRERALSWTDDEVLERYGKLFENAKAQLEPLTDEARAERIELYRAPLDDLSWFMRSLNEHIARRANREDVWGSGPDDVWAVGAEGSILHWDGTSWRPSDSGVDTRLEGVWGTGAGDVWVVGGGLILHSAVE